MSTVLKLKFQNAEGESLTHSFNYADATKGAHVRALMAGMIGNRQVFTGLPTTMVSAEFVTTTTVPVEL